MKVIIVDAGPLPVPAVKGGAVENLIENIVKQNECHDVNHISVVSVFDKDAKKMSEKYRKANFIFVKKSLFFTFLDNFLMYIFNFILGEKNFFSKNIFSRIVYTYKISKVLKLGNFDRVVLENSATLFWTLKFKKNWKKYDGRIYFHFHNDITGTYGCKKIIKRAKFIAISNFMYKKFPDYLSGIDDSQKLILKNSIDTNFFNNHHNSSTNEKIRKNLNISDTEKMVFFAGRIVPEKGILELVKAVKQINNLKLVIAGSPFFALKNGDSSFLINLKREIGEDSKKIIFTGYINYWNLADFYKTSDLVVVPSVWEEPAALTNIEALCCGKRLITTNRGGIPEYVSPGDAMVIDVTDNFVNTLKNAICRMLSTANEMDLNSISKKYIKNYNLETYYLNFCNILER